MKKIKTPVKIPLSYDSSICNIINDFINIMENITDVNVEVDCDLKGNIIIYYQTLPSSNKTKDVSKILMGHNKPKNKNKHTFTPVNKDDVEVSYRNGRNGGNEKSTTMSESYFKKLRNARKITDK